MTTSPCDGRRGLGPSRLARAPGCFRPGAIAALALAALASPAPAQELSLPSGHPARLFDVVLEAAGAAMAPDAFTDPEALEEGAAGEGPLDRPEGEATAAAGDARAGGIARFRLVVPGLGAEGLGWEAVAGDFLWLCESVALPALAANGWAPTEVVVSLADRETVFGLPDPEAVQFFEGFRIAEGACVPQAF